LSRIWLAASLAVVLLLFLGIVCFRSVPLPANEERERPVGRWAQLRADSSRAVLTTGIPGLVLHTAAWCMVIYDEVNIRPVTFLAFLLGNTLLAASMAYYTRVRLHWVARCLLGWIAPLGLLVMACLAHFDSGRRPEQIDAPRGRR
jgi:hypothetical protein